MLTIIQPIKTNSIDYIKNLLDICIIFKSMDNMDRD